MNKAGEDKQRAAEGVTILHLRLFSCRYVTGKNEDDESLFCGQEVHRVSYCARHYRMCYIKRKVIEPVK